MTAHLLRSADLARAVGILGGCLFGLSTSTVGLPAQERLKADLRPVTFEQLVLDRYGYDGERVALRGFCTRDGNVHWSHEQIREDDPARRVRLERQGPVEGCDPGSRVWAVGMFTAEQEYLGRIALERPLRASLTGGRELLRRENGALSFAGLSYAAPIETFAGAPRACPTPLTLDPVGLARANAPTLRFAEPERYFPTLPFHTAFDTLDLDGDGLVGFDDPDEVAPLDQAGANGVAWTRLRDAYDQAFFDLKKATGPGQFLYPPVPAVLYRVRMLETEDINRLWRFLRTDEQAWRRHGMDDFWDRWKDGCQAMASVEYYFYYLDDWGLEGHQEDIEFEFVFVTLNPADSTTDLRVAVGAGHGSRTPNNTLVMVESSANRANHVLVELGGHASAPDAPPRSEFAKFIDVNWHPTDLWGTRDVLALAGSGFIGRYSPDMTLPRERGLALLPRIGDRTIGYSLLPVADFQALDSLLIAGAADAEILSRLRRIASGVPGATVPDVLPPEVRRSLERWREPLCCGKSKETKPSKRRVWDHDHFKKGPAAILMSHLYRPTDTSLRDWRDYVGLWTWSVTWVPDDMAGASVGVVLPVLFQEQIPVRIRGFLTTELGWARAAEEEPIPRRRAAPPSARRTRDGWTLRLTYDWSYSRLIGWYAGAQYSSDEWDHRDRRFDNSFSLSGGASLLLMTAADRYWSKPFRVLRLRVGPRVRIGEFDDLLRDVGVNIQVVFR